MKLVFILALIALFNVSCGKVGVEDSTHEVGAKVEGETYNYVIVQLDFIVEVRELCENLYPVNENPRESARLKLVSECVFENLSILNTVALGDFTNNICKNPKTSEEFTICSATSF